MKRIEEGIWEELEAKELEPNQLNAIEALVNSENPALAAIDYQKNRHLIIPVPDNVEFNDNESQGLSVSTKRLQINNQPLSRFIDVCCNISAYFDMFNLIGGEISEQLEKPDADASKVVSRTLARWREFWKRLPKDRLSEEQIIGLFGELWFLLYWLLPKCNEPMEYWTGPYGIRHDFQFPNCSFEIKTSTKTKEIIHHIVSLEQLETVGDKPLFLYSLLLQRDISSENTVSDLIDQIESIISVEQSSIFKRILSEIGYSPLHSEDYKRYRYSVRGEGIYLVEKGFPHLTRKSFVEDALSGVVSVEYDISLSNLEQLKLSSSPDHDFWLNIDLI